MEEADPSEQDELDKAIEMSLEETKGEVQSDMVMRKEGGTYVVKQFDIVIDLITYFKDQIILNAGNNDILKADLSVYMLTKTIKSYGKYRTSLDHEHLDPKINDCLIEIIEKSVTSANHTVMLDKSKSCETVYVIIELINSLVSFYDKQPINLISKSRKSKVKKVKPTSSKELPKARMRTQIIFNLVKRMKAKMAPTQDEPTLVLWLSAVIEKISQDFIENKRDLVIENHDDGSLLKIQTDEHMWRWNNILKSLTLSKSKNFDLQVLSSCLDLLSNLIHFERLYYKWEVHQKQIGLKDEPREKKNIVEQEKELVKTIHNSDISELSKI
jgi:hypothetical protein